MTFFFYAVENTILIADKIIQIYKNEREANESIWVVVDSDGEEESLDGSQKTLRESDIIALFNQIPFATLFKKVFK